MIFVAELCPIICKPLVLVRTSKFILGDFRWQLNVIDAQAIPQSSFARRSRILDSKECREAVAALAGIKAGEALRVTLSPEAVQLEECDVCLQSALGVAYQRCKTQT